MDQISKFIQDQLSVWPFAAANFRALKSMRVRTVTVGGLEAKIQFNPCRILSSTAKIDEASLAARACFLCEANRPPEQFHINFEGRKGRRYNVQVNPYPIFAKHLVIARSVHLPQAIWHHLPDMLDFAWNFQEYIHTSAEDAGSVAPGKFTQTSSPLFVLFGLPSSSCSKAETIAASAGPCAGETRVRSRREKARQFMKQAPPTPCSPSKRHSSSISRRFRKA